MRRHSQNMQDGEKGRGVRFGTKALSHIAALALVASMCPGAAALAFANEQLTAGSVGSSQLSAQAEIVSSNTHRMVDGKTYRVNNDVTIEPDGSGNGTAPTKPAPAKASSSPKTGDYTLPLAGGIAIVALLAVGALGLSLARRRR